MFITGWWDTIRSVPVSAASAATSGDTSSATSTRWTSRSPRPPADPHYPSPWPAPVWEPPEHHLCYIIDRYHAATSFFSSRISASAAKAVRFAAVPTAAGPPSGSASRRSCCSRYTAIQRVVLQTEAAVPLRTEASPEGPPVTDIIDVELSLVAHKVLARDGGSRSPQPAGAAAPRSSSAAGAAACAARRRPRRRGEDAPGWSRRPCRQ